VDLGPARVIDPGYHPPHAERLPGHPGRDDVGVVTAADRDEGIGALDPRLGKHGPVEADPGDAVAFERGAEPAERLRIPVDDRYRVAPVLENMGERRPDPTAAHDYDVHDRPPTMSRSLSEEAPRHHASTTKVCPPLALSLPGRQGIFSTPKKGARVELADHAHRPGRARLPTGPGDPGDQP